MTTLNDLLARKDITIAEVRAHLDSLAPETRVRQATTLERNRQAKLWAITAGGDKITTDDLVPSATGTFDPVAFDGQNDQPMLRNFQKIFYRLPDGSLAGRNAGVAAPYVGHGYYSVVAGGEDGVYIDYTKLPRSKPSDWPTIGRNDRGLSIAVYGFMKDYLRRVHGRILIGHAEKPILGSMGHFVLARPD